LEVNPAAIRTVGEPGFARYSRSHGTSDGKRGHLSPPIAALRPAPRDGVGQPKEEFLGGGAVLVAYEAGLEVARNLDEALIVPGAERFVSLEHDSPSALSHVSDESR